MDVDKMKTIPLSLDGALERQPAQEEARAAAQGQDPAVHLVAWYDRQRQTGGPQEACAGEPPKCVRDYAASHGAEYRVQVNDSAYEFYFGSAGEDVAELDREWAIKIHDETEASERERPPGT